MTEITRGRQYELPGPPEPEAPNERTFGLMLRRPGDVANPDAELGAADEREGIYTAPDFTQRREWWASRAGADPRDSNRDNQWSLSLPHQCDEWSIWDGDREDVLAAAYRLRAELDGAIVAMEAGSPLRWHYGPIDYDPTPGTMWCYDCGGVVLIVEGVHGCTGCGREGDGDG